MSKLHINPVITLAPPVKPYYDIMLTNKNSSENMPSFTLDISGDYACFTRPEMKAERVSYDIITPSAARAVFEAIFWKPAISWHVTRIQVRKPVRFIAVRRNEVNHVISAGAVKSAMKNGRGKLGVYAEEERLQRAGLLLKDPEYRVTAEMTVKNGEDPVKMREMFRRRAEKGQCFMQPYLGCREFAANFRLCGGEEAREPSPLPENRDFGFMLYDMDYSDTTAPAPMFYRAIMKNGEIQVPAPGSEEIRA